MNQTNAMEADTTPQQSTHRQNSTPT